jgi:hypothetical protein
MGAIRAAYFVAEGMARASAGSGESFRGEAVARGAAA